MFSNIGEDELYLTIPVFQWSVWCEKCVAARYLCRYLETIIDFKRQKQGLLSSFSLVLLSTHHFSHCSIPLNYVPRWIRNQKAQIATKEKKSSLKTGWSFSVGEVPKPPLKQCCRSVTFWYGSGHPGLWLKDPDPAIFVSDLQDANKKLFFCIDFSFEGTLTSFFKDKKDVTKQYQSRFFFLFMPGNRRIRIGIQEAKHCFEVWKSLVTDITWNSKSFLTLFQYGRHFFVFKGALKSTQ